jgi:hypothetical protein
MDATGLFPLREHNGDLTRRGAEPVAAGRLTDISHSTGSAMPNECSGTLSHHLVRREWVRRSQL